MVGVTRRAVLAGTGAAALTGIAGCIGAGSPRSSPTAETTLYVGAYHWGFVVLDETGRERDQVTVDLGTAVRFVGFSLEATDAIASLPTAVRNGMTSHDELESRNADRIPAPNGGSLDEALEAAEDRYPDHSIVIAPAGAGRMGGGMMNGGMMGGRGLYLAHDATEPTTATITAGRRGDYSIDCGNYCGYGHPYMALDGVLTVR